MVFKTTKQLKGSKHGDKIIRIGEFDGTVSDYRRRENRTDAAAGGDGREAGEKLGAGSRKLGCPV